jgi:hypothetical protein
LDRLEVTLWELESSATEDELAAAKTMKVASPKLEGDPARQGEVHLP